MKYIKYLPILFFAAFFLISQEYNPLITKKLDLVGAAGAGDNLGAATATDVSDLFSGAGAFLLSDGTKGDALASLTGPGCSTDVDGNVTCVTPETTCEVGDTCLDNPSYGIGNTPDMFFTTNDKVLSATTAWAGTINEIRVVAFRFPRPITVNSIIYRRGNNVVGSAGIAVYDSTGVLVINSGVIDTAGSAGNLETTLGSTVELNAGDLYYIAWSADTTTSQTSAYAQGSAAAALLNDSNLTNKTFYTAAETFSAGMPASINPINLVSSTHGIIVAIGFLP